MTDLIIDLEDSILSLTLNRVAKRNAFDNALLQQLQSALDAGIADSEVQVIVLKAAGSHFSAGADISWMQSMQHYSEAENVEDARVLAKLMHSLYECPKPTIAVVQGSAFGGGLGLIAACDIAFAADNAQFCFSEVRLGLIPAVISPYVIKAIGARAATHLFLSAEQAKELQLIQLCLPHPELQPFAWDYAKKLAALPPKALKNCKALVREVMHRPIDAKLVEETAQRIAKQRVSAEGQAGLQAFLNQRKNHVS